MMVTSQVMGSEEIGSEEIGSEEIGSRILVLMSVDQKINALLALNFVFASSVPNRFCVLRFGL